MVVYRADTAPESGAIGHVNMRIINVTTKTPNAMTVSLSRFFSTMPRLVEDDAIDAPRMSETPVPRPECMRINATVAIPETNQMTQSKPFRIAI